MTVLIKDSSEASVSIRGSCYRHWCTELNLELCSLVRAAKEARSEPEQ